MSQQPAPPLPEFEDLGFARVDHDRTRRRGYPETIYCGTKTTDQVVTVAERMVAAGTTNIMATRVDARTAAALAARFPNAVVDEQARIVIVQPLARTLRGSVAVVGWRTEDHPVAREVALTATTMGSRVELRLDAPVAEPQRFPQWFDTLSDPTVVVVVDGTGSSLASVVAGLSSVLVIAVPTCATSEAEGVAALLSALSSCVPGILTVNPDNGFGAGYAAHLINVRVSAEQGGRPSTNGQRRR